MNVFRKVGLERRVEQLEEQLREMARMYLAQNQSIRDHITATNELKDAIKKLMEKKA